MKENAGLEKASENAAGSDRTSQYNQYKGEEERERRANQKRRISPLDGVF